MARLAHRLAHLGKLDGSREARGQTPSPEETFPMSQPGLPQLPAIQSAIQQLGCDGWLLYDFRGLNVLARRVLGFPAGAMLSRRWFYFIPAKGEPRKLVHRIEPHALDAYPGDRTIYLRWQELEAGVAGLVRD